MPIAHTPHSAIWNHYNNLRLVRASGNGACVSYVEIPPACELVSLRQSSNDNRAQAAAKSSRDVHAGLCNCQETRQLSEDHSVGSEMCALRGRHFLGKISLGMQYARGTVAKPNPIRVWAAIRRPMVVDPGAMAEPMKDIAQKLTRMVFLAWKVSEIDDMMGPTTA